MSLGELARKYREDGCGWSLREWWEVQREIEREMPRVRGLMAFYFGPALCEYIGVTAPSSFDYGWNFIGYTGTKSRVVFRCVLTWQGGEDKVMTGDILASEGWRKELVDLGELFRIMYLPLLFQVPTVLGRGRKADDELYPYKVLKLAEKGRECAAGVERLFEGHDDLKRVILGFLGVV